jgi:DNA-binding transcriptional LysR family regulator
MNFNAIDLNLLRVFEFLMQERSVTGAAERLGRTQSAVSHSLGKLRLLFGDELFMREGGLMNPTPRAVELGVDLSAALADIRATIDRHQSFDPSQTRRNFRVGLTDYHAMIFIPTIIQRFGEDAPYATVNFIPSTRLEVTELIQSRQLDCAILGNFEEESSNILKLQLGEDRLACAIWSGSTLLRHPLGLGPYLAATHVRVSADGMSESLADRALRDRGMQRSVHNTELYDYSLGSAGHRPDCTLRGRHSSDAQREQRDSARRTADSTARGHSIIVASSPDDQRSRDALAAKPDGRNI